MAISPTAVINSEYISGPTAYTKHGYCRGSLCFSYLLSAGKGTEFSFWERQRTH